MVDGRNGRADATIRAARVLTELRAGRKCQYQPLIRAGWRRHRLAAIGKRRNYSRAVEERRPTVAKLGGEARESADKLISQKSRNYFRFFAAFFLVFFFAFFFAAMLHLP